MPGLRLLAVTVIAGLVTIGVLSDREDRPGPVRTFDAPLMTSDASRQTWFCPGGEVGGELARVSLMLINVADEPAEVTISVLGGDQAVMIKPVEARSQRSVPLEDLAPTARWAGALVETSSADVFVEQSFFELSTESSNGADRLPCSTTAATRHLTGNGATRTVADGEKMALVLANPFQADAVVDLRFDTDVGLDSRSAVVVPRRSVVAIAVEEEVPVAGRIHVVAETQAGRLVVQRIQTRNAASVGLSVVPAVQDGAVVSVLPSVSVEDGIVDRVYVTNPSDEAVAEVDLEVLPADGAAPDPIELTVRPGRTVVVDVASEARLADLGTFALRARSLTGIPVAVSLEREVARDQDAVGGLAGMPAMDGAATRWLGAQGLSETTLSIVNPSASAAVSVEIQLLRPDQDPRWIRVELEPDSVAHVNVTKVASEALINLTSSGPVVVAREDRGSASRQLMGSVARQGLSPLR